MSATVYWCRECEWWYSDVSATCPSCKSEMMLVGFEAGLLNGLRRVCKAVEDIE